MEGHPNTSHSPQGRAEVLPGECGSFTELREEHFRKLTCGVEIEGCPWVPDVPFPSVLLQKKSNLVSIKLKTMAKIQKFCAIGSVPVKAESRQAFIVISHRQLLVPHSQVLRRET